MDKRLIRLIADYQGAVGSAIRMLSDSRIRIPSSSREWFELDLPAEGNLDSGIRYMKHGYGCLVDLPGRCVDFDFGEHGEIDEFDEWRLWEFCRGKPHSYGFDTEAQLSVVIEGAIKKGILVATEGGRYFVADSMKVLSEADARTLTEGCALPHYSRDCVQKLAAQCFDSADLMLKQFLPLDALRREKRTLSAANGIKFRVYLLSWLGYLYATAEGFKSLRVRILLKSKRPASFLELVAESDALGSLEKKHTDDLRVLRNDTFHLRADDEAIGRFFSDDGDRIEWARKLHEAFDTFFSNYRVLAEVHYFVSGRLGESRIRGGEKSPRRRRTEGRAVG